MVSTPFTQLIGLERHTTRSGKDSIDHARGGHDDLANAAVGALLQATAKKPTMRVGAIDFAKTGRVFWHDEEPERPRLRILRSPRRRTLSRGVFSNGQGDALVAENM